MTVMPAPSSASVRSRKVSGESSTTRATSRLLGSVVIAVQCFQGGHVLIQIETVDQQAHLRNKIGMLGMIGPDLVEFDLNGPDVTHLPEADQFLDMPHRRPRSADWIPGGNRNLVSLILPFDLEQLSDQFQQPRNIDRLHQIT